MKKPERNQPSRKPSTLKISLKVPEGAEGPFSLSINPADGSVIFRDRNGREVLPESMERSLHYDRPSKPKYQSRLALQGAKVSVGGLTELTQFEQVFAIDTNTRIIDGITISAAAFVIFRFVPEGDAFRIVLEDKRLHICELRGAPAGKAEMLAILKVAHDFSQPRSMRTGRIAFATDSHLDSHDAMRSGMTPIYGEHPMPENVELIYASPETGQEALNQLIRFCDKLSSDYLNKLQAGRISGPELQPVLEDGAIQFRYMQNQEEVKVLNPVITGVAIGPSTTASLHYE